jgi:hypothetical protein
VIEVSLTPQEIHLAAMHGLVRRIDKHKGLRGDRIQKERSTWDNEIEGACAELAWCKARGIYWAGVADIRSKDNREVEIRWTKHEHGGLIVYPHDKDESIFVLAKGFAPDFRFVGWLTGARGKELGEKTDFGHLVPEDKLNGM